MDVSRLPDLKPRSVWEVTDDAFDVYREHFAALAGITAVVAAPVLIILSVWLLSGYRDLDHFTSSSDQFGRFLAQMAWIVPLVAVAAMLQSAATALAVRDILTGAAPTILSVYRRVFQRFLPLLFGALLPAAVAFILSCVPFLWIFIAVWYAFTAHGIVLEDRKLLDSMKRSRDVSQNYFGKTLGMICLMTVINVAFFAGCRALISEAFSILPKAEGSATPYAAEQFQSLVAAVSSSVLLLLLLPLPAIAVTLLYYDLRVRREGLDVESEAATWGVPLAPDPFGGVLNPKQPKPAKMAKIKGAKK